MKPLYQINEDFRRLADQIGDQGGEVTPEQETALSITREQLTDKSRNYIHLLRRLQGEKVALEEDIKRLTVRLNAVKRLDEFLRNGLVKAVEAFGPFAVDTYKVGVRANPYVSIEDTDKIPDVYMVRSVTRTPDKMYIRRALEDGQEVPGASLKSRNSLALS